MWFSVLSKQADNIDGCTTNRSLTPVLVDTPTAPIRVCLSFLRIEYASHPGGGNLRLSKVASSRKDLVRILLEFGEQREASTHNMRRRMQLTVLLHTPHRSYQLLAF